MQCEVAGRGIVREKREALNKQIRALECADTRPESLVLKSKQRVVVVDVCHEIKYFDCDDATRKKFWCPDGLHMTKVGYNRTGMLIHKSLSGLV
jgi:hypothetical protein